MTTPEDIKPDSAPPAAPENPAKKAAIAKKAGAPVKTGVTKIAKPAVTALERTDSYINDLPVEAVETPATWAKVHAAKIIQRAAAKSGRKGAISANLRQKASNYWQLMRMNRPIGTLLLLWPTLWSLWLAAKGVPSIKNLVIFVLGVIVMRAAGCVINDFADRKIDGKVLRTKNRPLATGAVTSREAVGLFIVLCLIAFTLVLFTDPLTIKLSVGGLLLAFCYPFMKRHTHLPQVVLGAAFAWGIPMAYAAEAGELNQNMWLIYLAVVLLTVAYDTFYAMVDRDDDVKIGVKSTAILFGEQDRVITGILQFLTLYTLVLVGKRFELGSIYYLGLVVAAGLFIYQQWLIRFRAPAACFKAFLNNNWVGIAVFAGIAGHYALQ
jgi:4-hydroxybenzoate polyprenyltransferase